MNEQKLLPAPESAQPVSHARDVEREHSQVPLAHYLWVIKRHRWKILAPIVACVAATLVVSSRQTPIYESTATVDIDRQMPVGVVGQDATRTPADDADQFIATQIRLIQSDSVLRPVALQYHLVDFSKKSSNAPAQKFSVAQQDSPISLGALRVTRPPNTFLLLLSYRSPDPRLAADVANGVAQSYVQHAYDIRFHASASLASFMETQIEELKAKMERSSAALSQFERELNVINPEEKTSILSARLSQLNTEYTNAQTERVRKESAWKSVQSGSLEAAQVSTQGDNLKTLAAKLDDARQKFADVKTHYGANHPEYRKAAVQVEEIERQLHDARQNAVLRVEVEYREAVDREAMLQKALIETKAESDRINARSFEYQAVKREADADKALYDELVRKIKEAGINAGFQNNSIRIADPARPASYPVLPQIRHNAMMAFLWSSLLALGAAILSDVLDKSLRDPEAIANLFQIQVMGSLPLVKSWHGRLAASLSPEGTVALPVDSTQAGNRRRGVTGFEEAIQALRNSIMLGTFDRRLKSLMITSATPAEGKTTAAVYLAIAHARQKHKTLLIDCDMRRPGVQGRLGINPESGLATILQNGLRWRERLVKLAELENLDILPAGHASRRAADLVGASLPRILEEAINDYDLIIVDAPPMLGFSEPLQMSAVVDGVVLVALAGQTNRAAVGSALKKLQLVRASVVGLVLNEVTTEMSDTYLYHGYYGKYYRYYNAEK